MSTKITFQKVEKKFNSKPRKIKYSLPETLSTKRMHSSKVNHVNQQSANCKARNKVTRQHVV